MTFLQLQNRVMSRLNWSSTDARTLVKEYLNERYREVQSSLGLTPTRRGTATVNTTSGNRTLAFTGVAKLLGVFDATILKRPLEETTVDDIRTIDAADAVSGTPTHYAIQKHQNDTITLLLHPVPNAVSALVADALLSGTEMVNDADEPTLPTDFHDLLIHGAEADGRMKMEKMPLAQMSLSQYHKRLSDLRYFIAKSAHLHQVPRDSESNPLGRRSWPYSNLI